MRRNQGNWIRVAEAARRLRYSDDKVRRLIAEGHLQVTRDPEILRDEVGGRGAPPQMLVSVESLELVQAEDVIAATVRRSPELTLEHVREMQREIASLNREVTRLSALADSWRDIAVNATKSMADSLKSVAEAERTGERS